MGRLVVFLVVIYGLHFGANGWWMNATAGSCSNPTSAYDHSVCSCLKSEMRQSIALYQAMFGAGDDKVERIFRYCKGLS